MIETHGKGKRENALRSVSVSPGAQNYKFKRMAADRRKNFKWRRVITPGIIGGCSDILYFFLYMPLNIQFILTRDELTFSSELFRLFYISNHLLCSSIITLISHQPQLPVVLVVDPFGFNLPALCYQNDDTWTLKS